MMLLSLPELADVRGPPPRGFVEVVTVGYNFGDFYEYTNIL
jgi:hypothetical protein